MNCNIFGGCPQAGDGLQEVVNIFLIDLNSAHVAAKLELAKYAVKKVGQG